MDVIEFIFLGLLQGITEFLPISSTAHLEIARWLLPFPKLKPDLAFTLDIALHLGTLLSILWYFRDKIFKLAKAFISSILERKLEGDPYRKLSWLFILSAVPAGLAGHFFEDIIETKLRFPPLIAFSLILVGILLFIIEKYRIGNRKLEDCNLIDSIFIGIAQTLALIPGTSRSGITITAGLFRGLTRDDATEFSFLMAIPIIGGGATLKLLKAVHSGSILNIDKLCFILAIISSVISGYIAIRFLLKYLQKGTFYPFIYYRWALGAVILVIYYLKYR